MADSRTEFSKAVVGYERQTLSTREVKIEALAPNLALAIVTAQWSVTDTLGASTEPRDFAHTSVWRLENGKWKVLHEHESFAAGEE